MSHVFGTVVASVVLLVLAAVAPQRAEALCCACRSCPDLAFCVDDINSSVVCATLCLSAGCTSTVFDSADTCEGGCDGAPAAPTATASSTRTSSATPSATPPATATATPPATATATSSAAGTATATPTVTAALSGQILYYANDLPVPGATVALTAGTTQATTTDAGGNFAFASVEDGAQTLEPTKQNDFNVAVTALDGTRVLEFVAGLGNLDENQRLAADVTGDGTISALDATRILEFAAGVLVRFAVAENCGSDWAFRPEPQVIPNQTLIEPEVGPAPMCTRGAIQYDAQFMPPASGQDFTAVLFGDVTGNWMPDVP